jgi:hypothetical protein
MSIHIYFVPNIIQRRVAHLAENLVALSLDVLHSAVTHLENEGEYATVI